MTGRMCVVLAAPAVAAAVFTAYLSFGAGTWFGYRLGYREGRQDERHRYSETRWETT